MEWLKLVDLRRIQRVLIDGNNPYIDINNIERVLIHLCEETGEICKAYRKRDREGLAKEMGDLIILACFFAESVGLDLEECTIDKIKENIKDGKFRLKVGEML